MTVRRAGTRAWMVVGLLLLAAGCGGSEDRQDDAAASNAAASAAVDRDDGDESTGTGESADEAQSADEDGGASAGGDETGDDGAEDEESRVRDVHTRFMTELFDIDERVEDPAIVLPAAEELTTGNQLERIRQRVRHDTATGEALVGSGYDTNIVSVEIDDDRATVLDCSLDPAELYGADGEVLVPADDFHKLRSTELVLVDGTWLVENFITGGDERCDPDEQSDG